MAWTTLARPGTKTGPCAKRCAHRDCAATRALSMTTCHLCQQPIGWDRAFCYDGAGDPVHFACATDAETARQTAIRQEAPNGR